MAEEREGREETTGAAASSSAGAAANNEEDELLAEQDSAEAMDADVPQPSESGTLEGQTSEG